MSCSYIAIGIRADWKRNTGNGNGVYAVRFCEQDGSISDDFSVRADLLAYWHVRRGNNCGRWRIDTEVTKGGREVIRSIVGGAA